MKWALVGLGCLFAWVLTACSRGYSGGHSYVAFSLAVAQKRVEVGGDWRKEHPEVLTLGGMTNIRGVVHDQKRRDLVLVGQRDEKRPPLTLDDFVVALRARLVLSQWPSVSLGPQREEENRNLQRVSYEGGIENSAFGSDIFEADLTLKRIALGELESGAAGLDSYWTTSVESFKRQQEHQREQTEVTFWLSPVSGVVRLGEGVVGIEGLKVAVLSRVMSASCDGKPVEDLETFSESTRNNFSRQMRERYPELAAAHPSIARLEGMSQLWALARAIQEMTPPRDLDYWLLKYQIEAVDTPEQQEVVGRRWDDREGGARHLEMCGGVGLIAVVLPWDGEKGGAVREAVLATRPGAEQLVWNFTLAQWPLVPSPEGQERSVQSGLLLAEATFLQRQGFCDAAISLCDQILALEPDFADAYYGRGYAFSSEGEHDRAVADYSKAVTINSRHAEAYYQRGRTFMRKRLYDLAIRDFTKAIGIDAYFIDAYNNRGNSYKQGLGDLESAIADYTKAIAVAPSFWKAYNNRGGAYLLLGENDQAIEDCNKGIALEPSAAEPYSTRGCAYSGKGLLDRAISDHDKAIALNPNDAKAYYNRGNAYAGRRDHDHAIEDYDKAILLNPNYSWAYNNRGNALADKGDYGRAIQDYDKAIAIAGFFEAYLNRGNAYANKGDYDRAIQDYDQAIARNPSDVHLYCSRGKAYVRKRLYELALADVDRAFDIEANSAEAYNLRGVVLAEAEGDYDKAMADYDKAIGIDPNYPEAYYSRALACEKLGRGGEALALYKKFVELAPRGCAAEIENAQERIKELEGN